MTELVTFISRSDGSEWATIPFTQFLLPHGERRPEVIDRPADIGRLARDVHAAGGRFTVEMLRTGAISLACEWRDCDIAIEVVPNGPEVLSAVDRMIVEAHRLVTLHKDNPDFPLGDEE